MESAVEPLDEIIKLVESKRNLRNVNIENVFSSILMLVNQTKNNIIGSLSKKILNIQESEESGQIRPTFSQIVIQSGEAQKNKNVTESIEKKLAA